MSGAAEIAAKLTAVERAIVMTGDPDSYRNFKHTAAHAEVAIEEVPEACRSLRALGIMNFIRNGMTDDGEFYGAGYGLSEPLGLEVRAHLSRERGE